MCYISLTSTSPRSLKFSGELLLTLVKLLKKADFGNLPSGQFYSHFTDFHDFEVAIKMLSGQI